MRARVSAPRRFRPAAKPTIGRLRRTITFCSPPCSLTVRVRLSVPRRRPRCRSSSCFRLQVERRWPSPEPPSDSGNTWISSATHSPFGPAARRCRSSCLCRVVELRRPTPQSRPVSGVARQSRLAAGVVTPSAFRQPCIVRQAARAGVCSCRRDSPPASSGGRRANRAGQRHGEPTQYVGQWAVPGVVKPGGRLLGPRCWCGRLWPR